MPFPTTGILDDFNRANADPLSGNWRNEPIFPWNAVNLAIISNQLSASQQAADVYDQLFPADVELYITLANLTDLQWLSLYFRMSTWGSGLPDGYGLMYDPAGPEIAFEENDPDWTWWSLSTSISLSAGNKLGLQAVGNQMQGYVDTGSGWTPVGAPASDPTYNQAGNVGIFVDRSSNSFRLDDLGGGAYVPPLGPGRQAFFGALPAI